MVRKQKKPDELVPDIKSNWTLQPRKIADITVNNIVSTNIIAKNLEKDVLALKEGEQFWQDVASKFVAEGRKDDAAQAVARELRETRTKILLTEERKSHTEALNKALGTLFDDEKIRPEIERRMNALNSLTQPLLDDPDVEKSTKDFLKNYREVFTRGGRNENK